MLCKVSLPVVEQKTASNQEGNSSVVAVVQSYPRCLLTHLIVETHAPQTQSHTQLTYIRLINHTHATHHSHHSHTTPQFFLHRAVHLITDHVGVPRGGILKHRASPSLPLGVAASVPAQPSRPHPIPGAAHHSPICHSCQVIQQKSPHFSPAFDHR